MHNFIMLYAKPALVTFRRGYETHYTTNIFVFLLKMKIKMHSHSTTSSMVL